MWQIFGKELADLGSYLIFVRGAGGEKNLSCGEIFHITDFHVENYIHMVNVENNLSNGGIFHMKNVENKSVLSQFTLFSCKI